GRARCARLEALMIKRTLAVVICMLGCWLASSCSSVESSVETAPSGPRCTGTLGFPGAPWPSVGDYPESVAAAGLDGDGRVDLAIAAAFAGRVNLLFGRGDGSFAPAVDLAVDGEPIAVAAADLNGDGKPDLAVVDLTANDVSVLLNLGNGGFAPVVS